MAEMPTADEIAVAVAVRLQGSFISSVLPNAIGDAVREACSHGSIWWRQSVPLAGPKGIGVHWKLNPDGSMLLELDNWAGEVFWRGIFQPNGGS